MSVYVQGEVCLSDSLKPEYGSPRRSSNSNTPLPWSHVEIPAHPCFPLLELLKHKCFVNIALQGPALAVGCAGVCGDALDVILYSLLVVALPWQGVEPDDFQGPFPTIMILCGQQKQP